MSEPPVAPIGLYDPPKSDADLDALEKKIAGHHKVGAYCVATHPETMKLIEELRLSRRVLRYPERA